VPRSDSNLRDKGRQLRREPTEAEKRLWSILRDRQLEGAHFRRQHPIPPYVAEFACVDAKLIVEVDGGQHMDRDHDAQRTTYLQRHGWRVLRLPSNDVLGDTDGVGQQIAEALRSPALPPETGEGRGGGSPLPRATAIAADGTPVDTVTLAYDDRHRRRLRLTTDAGQPFLLDLAEAQVLRDGHILALDDGRLVQVRAAPEAVLDIQAPDALALARITWHLGNRHTPTQILPGALRIRADHVLEHLLTDHLGAAVTHATAPFDPEGGAYGHAPHDH
jgi:urease accessory protein